MALFITLEGGEGAGKTAVAEALADRARDRGAEVVLTREPGGTPLGHAIRDALFRADERLSAWSEAFLFLADRADHVQRVIRPALARGENRDKALQEERGVFPSDRLLEIEGGSLQLLALRRQLEDRDGIEDRKDQERFK